MAIQYSKTAGVILIGDELLSGQTQDKNLFYIAGQLCLKYIFIKRVAIISDDSDEIIKTVQQFSKAYDYVFTTGGIGPTHDDITAKSMALAFGRDFVLNQQALDCFPQDQTISPGYLRMSMMPTHVSLIRNAASYAPGFIIDNVYVMAGVPHIVQAMMNEVVKDLEPGQPIYTQYIIGQIKEGSIASDLEQLQLSHPAVSIGSYPHYETTNQWHLKLVFKGTDQLQLSKVVQQAQVFCLKQDPRLKVVID